MSGFLALGRLRSGEGLAGVAAIVLFPLTFLYWFGTKTVYETNLLYAISDLGPSQRSCWEALNFIPLFLTVTTIGALTAVALRVFGGPGRLLLAADALVAMLGAVSAMLIFGRIINPPVFDHVAGARFEGAVRYPAYLALISAAVVASGGLVALRERGTILGPTKRWVMRRIT